MIKIKVAVTADRRMHRDINRRLNDKLNNNYYPVKLKSSTSVIVLDDIGFYV